MIAMNKHEMRRFLRSQYPGKAARDEQSAHICRHIIASDVYKRAGVIGGYIPLKHEADIKAVLSDALQQGKTLVLPLCGAAPNMTMRRVNSMADLLPGAYGIPEPGHDAPVVSAEQIDLLLVPLEGIDRCGFRLGKGGGYYDALLAAHPGLMTMGCALSWQQVEAVPVESWDIPLAFCVDQNGINDFSDVYRKGNTYGQQEQED